MVLRRRNLEGALIVRFGGDDGLLPGRDGGALPGPNGEPAPDGVPAAGVPVPVPAPVAAATAARDALRLIEAGVAGDGCAEGSTAIAEEDPDSARFGSGPMSAGDSRAYAGGASHCVALVCGLT